MDIERMLERCHREQWSAEDLDWTLTPRRLSEADETMVVQLFTDMAEIELLAASLFEEQARRAEDPPLRAVFQSFVVDERRHSAVARRLADFYNVRRAKTYLPNPALLRFVPHFKGALRFLSDDIANAYITGGEIVLDVALLRALDDYVHDGMSASAMKLINRDEARHLSVDFHMVGYYASDGYAQKLAAEPPKRRRERARGAYGLAMMMYYAQPFFRAMFFEPMDKIDPSGRRLREAFKRMQLLGGRKDSTRRPFSRFLHLSFEVFNHPIAGRVFGGAAARLLGLDPRFIRRLTTEQELARAGRMSYDELAEETHRSV